MKIIIILITIVAFNCITHKARCIIEAKKAFERHNSKKIKFIEVR
ncbi:hypothetical protein [Clostridium paraputrificum]|nr:hypothetical protein [Clostridium paraputrificum]MDB2116911.1 hypothetical protein [Clostridium paraputrificum]